MSGVRGSAHCRQSSGQIQGVTDAAAVTRHYPIFPIPALPPPPACLRLLPSFHSCCLGCCFPLLLPFLLLLLSSYNSRSAEQGSASGQMQQHGVSRNVPASSACSVQGVSASNNKQAPSVCSAALFAMCMLHAAAFMMPCSRQHALTHPNAASLERALRKCCRLRTSLRHTSMHLHVTGAPAGAAIVLRCARAPQLRILRPWILRLAYLPQNGPDPPGTPSLAEFQASDHSSGAPRAGTGQVSGR